MHTFTWQITTSAPIIPKNGNPALTMLHEISMPDAINWMPQTLGWKALLLFLFTWLCYRVYLLRKRYLLNEYRRDAVLKISALDEKSITDLPKILKFVALHAYKRKDVSPITGTKWEQWLDEQCKKTDFSGELNGVLSRLAYESSPKLTTEELKELKAQTIYWIKHHRCAYD